VLSHLTGHYNYEVVVVLFMIGLYMIMASPNLVKKVLGLNIFQVAVFILYISLGKLEGGTAPIHDPAYALYSNPLPHVLILTAIVVGVATTALALALVVRIHDTYDSIEEDEINRSDDEADRRAETEAEPGAKARAATGTGTGTGTGAEGG
jgi:multicomponent Na+:H+ antiporter subunit C